MTTVASTVRRSWPLLVGAGLTGLTTTLQAQSVVYGVVRSDSTRRPIAGAEVVLPTLNRTVRSRGDGSYRLDQLPAGTYPAIARAIGFRPLSFEVTVSGADSAEIDLELVRSVQTLAPLKVDAAAPRFRSAAMEEFEERRKRGFGVFLDRAQLAALEPASVSLGLRRLSGVGLIYACGREFVATRRSGTGRATCGGKSLPDACYLAIYVDGARVWAEGDPQTPPDMHEYQLREFQAIEVYRGPAELPIEYQATGNACGAILFWTRTGEEP